MPQVCKRLATGLDDIDKSSHEDLPRLVNITPGMGDLCPHGTVADTLAEHIALTFLKKMPLVSA
jgi:hypothetical protein